jgi:hypothetical protein
LGFAHAQDSKPPLKIFMQLCPLGNPVPSEQLSFDVFAHSVARLAEPHPPSISIVAAISTVAS